MAQLASQKQIIQSHVKSRDVLDFFVIKVRVWEIFKDSYRLIEIMKEHKATVNCIKIKSNDKECVTASSDGACIIWDLV